MPTYNIKYRKHGAQTLVNVDAPTPEAAVRTQVLTAGVGEEISVMNVLVGTGPTGVSLTTLDIPFGATGPTGS